MKIKYWKVLSLAVQILFLNIILAKIVFAYKYGSLGNYNLYFLLKKYNVNLKKPEVKYIKTIKNDKKPPEVKRKISPIDDKLNNIPGFLKQKISLAGKGTIKSALMLLSREISVPIIIYGGFPPHLKNYAYYKEIPLYKILKGLIISNGFAYRYKNGTIYVYAEEEKTFHIPVSDLSSSFLSTVGMSSNSGQNNGINANDSGVSGSQSGQNNGSNSLNSINSISNSAGSSTISSNPSGALSLTLSEGGSLYNIISKNIKEMLTKNGKYFINPKDGLIWVKDRVSNVNEVAAYIKSINKFLSKQVFLKVEVIDVTLNKGFQTGINWNLLFNKAFESNAFGINSLSASAQLASANNIFNTPYIGFNGAESDEAILSALKTQGSVDVISQPRLVLMDGQTRMISSGTITPYISSIQTMALSLSQTETYPVISQVQTGLSISFTPHINFKNDSVLVTLSLIDNSITGYQSFSVSGESFSNPVIESKSFSDTVNVKSDSTILVGGILTTDKAKNTYGIPLLSKIPLIGYLFKSVNDSTQKQDLLIMLTPRIIL